MMRVGCPCYATTQGIGYLAKDFYDAGIVTDPLVFRYPRSARQDHPEWYPPGTPVVGSRVGSTNLSAVREWMRRIDVMLCFETPLDWELVAYARNCGKRTAVVTMYEWWPENPPAHFDLYLCPSRLDYDTFGALYADRTNRVEFLPVPAPSGTWRQRTAARRFLHNAGHVGSRNHKGTDTLLEAMNFVESPIDLTIRCQHPELLEKLIRSAGTWGSGKPWQVHLRPGEVPRGDLFGEEFDVYVAPEKYNGLSLPLQEAFASGMPVVTTDRHPANTWLPREPMVPVGFTRRVRVAPGHLEIDESVVEPRDLARVLDGIFGQDVTELSLRGKKWAEENSWKVLGPKWRAALEGLL